MKFFIRFFVGLIVLAVLGYGYIYYKNKTLIDDSFEMLNMFTSASYGSTYVNLSGQSVTKDVRVSIPGSGSEVTIDEFSFGSGSLIESFKMVRSIESNRTDSLPSELNARIKGLSLPLNSDTEDMFFLAAGDTDFLGQWQLAGCKNVKSLGVDELYKLGYNQIVSDFSAKIEFDTHINQMRFSGSFSAKDYLTNNLDFVVNGLDFMQINPQLNSITFEIINNGLNNKLNAYCAEQQGLTEEQFIERHMNYTKHLFYNEGLYMSDEFYNLYSDFASNPRSFKITSHPSQSTSLDEYSMLSPRLMLSKMNLSVAFNDKTVGQLLGNRPDVSELPQLDEVTPVEETLRTVQGITLQNTAKDQLQNHIGREMHFNYRGKKYRGYIVSVSSNEIRVNVQISPGNSIEMPFVLSETSNVRVRREVLGQ